MTNSKKRSADICIALLFLAALMVPAAVKGMGLGLQTAEMIHEKENREIAKKPALFFCGARLRDFTRYLDRLEKYLLDTFPFRSQIISELFATQRNSFAKQGSDGVFGKDGWLFYNASDAKTVNDFVSDNDIGYTEFLRHFTDLNKKRLFFESQGLRYYFMVAPNKITVHSEMLPEEFSRAKGTSFRESFMSYYREYIRKHALPDFIIDPTQALIAAKQSQGALYFPQDTHWNWRGRLVAANVICDRLRLDFPELGRVKTMKMKEGLGWRDLVSIVNVLTSPEMRGSAPFPDVSEWAHVECVQPERSRPKTVFTHEVFYRNDQQAKSGINAIIVGDSFFDSFQPLAEALVFNTLLFRSRFLHDVYDSLHYHRAAYPEIIPNVIVEERVERYLPEMINPKLKRRVPAIDG